ncbi:MAG: MFS transporter, partial [Hyphomicrobiaceae bacterium]
MSGPARPSELRPALVLLIAITAIGPFAMNVSVPLMPGLAKDFGTSYAVIQLTLTAYLVATAVSTPILGPLSDQHGRRPVLLAGIFIFMVGSLVCASAPTAEVLIAGRALQAVGGASGWVLARTVIYDVYGPRRAASLIGYVTMAMVLAPMVAPA